MVLFLSQMEGDCLSAATVMRWRLWRSRISATPKVFLLPATLVALFFGYLAFTFLIDVVQLRHISAHSFPVDESRFRLLPVDFIRFPANCKLPIEAENVKSFIYENLFDGTSPFENFPSPEVATLLRKKRIKGWGAEDSVFEKLMIEVRPKVIVELGSFLGASAINMAQLARSLSLDSVILCVDDFRGWPGFRLTNFKDIKMLNGNNMLYYQFMKNIQFMNLTDTVVPIPYSTTGTLMKLCEWGILPDLIEVDAAHDFHSAWLDLNWAYVILRPGGVMFGHDYFNHGHESGVRRAVDLFAKMKNLKVEPDGKHWILRNNTIRPPD